MAAPKLTVDQLIDGVTHLPPAPTVMINLLSLFQQPDRDIDAVVAELRHDPSLTAEVLKRCNSAYFGGGEAVTDMFEAVARLGFYEVYCIVVALFGSRALRAPNPTGENEVAALWEHSVTAAVAAGVIAEETNESEGVPFTCGLLHDVGKVVLLSADAPRYQPLLQGLNTGGGELVEAERTLYGFDHAEVGAALLARWSLPEDLVVAVRYHHDLAGAKQYERLVAIVHFANVMAHHVGDNLIAAPQALAGGGKSSGVLDIAPDRISAILRTQKILNRIKALICV